MADYEYVYIIFVIIVAAIVIPIRNARRRQRRKRQSNQFHRVYAPNQQYQQVQTVQTQLQRQAQPVHQQPVYQQPAFNPDFILEDLKLNLASNIQRAVNGFQVVIPGNHKYANFTEIKIVHQSSGTHKIYATLKGSIPSSIDIRRRTSMVYPHDEEVIVPPIRNEYAIYSPDQKLWTNPLNQTEVVHRITNLQTNLEFLYIKDDYIESIVNEAMAIRPTLDLIIAIQRYIQGTTTDISSYQVEKLLCYNCEDPFDPLEEDCDKCGASRPRCIVCFLDLKPSEKQEVVLHPCCQIYSHKDHIMSWLKSSKTCPNCHNDLTEWSKSLFL